MEDRGNYGYTLFRTIPMALYLGAIVELIISLPEVMARLTI